MENRNDFTLLDQAGLNLQAVFNIAELPDVMRQMLLATDIDLEHYRQLILVGHAGPLLWNRLNGDIREEKDPIDHHTITSVKRWMQQVVPDADYMICYPGEHLIPLQQLGRLAGWHHDSPFRIGVNSRFGSWYAYRALLLADSDFTTTSAWPEDSPCAQCENRVCVAACPVCDAGSDLIDLHACIDYRLQCESVCVQRCPARLACPVADEFRYSDAQIAYHYQRSFQTIKAWKCAVDSD